MVFTALNQEKLTYLLDGKECDFYLEEKMYQVSYDIEEDRTRKREFEGLKYFANKFGNDRGYLITYDRNELLEYKNVTIEVLSLDKFLLESKV
jgi:hypothetical protein